MNKFFCTKNPRSKQYVLIDVIAGTIETADSIKIDYVDSYYNITLGLGKDDTLSVMIPKETFQAYPKKIVNWLNKLKDVESNKTH